jgi:hypothetical protein
MVNAISGQKEKPPKKVGGFARRNGFEWLRVV